MCSRLYQTGKENWGFVWNQKKFGLKGTKLDVIPLVHNDPGNLTVKHDTPGYVFANQWRTLAGAMYQLIQAFLILPGASACGPGSP